MCLFKKIHFFALGDEPLEADEFAARLTKRRFKPIGEQDMQSIGWAPMFEHGEILHRYEGQWMTKLLVEDRILPGKVVQRTLAERVAKDFERTGVRPGSKRRRELKEEVIADLRQKAFCQLSAIHVWIDPHTGFIATDGKADTVAEALRACEPPLDFGLVATRESPSATMSRWLLNLPPDDFTIDDACELRSAEKETVKYANIDLDRDDIRAHLSEGKIATQLALTHDGALSFVLTDKFEMKKLSLVDTTGEDENDVEKSDDPIVAFEAEFALMIGAVQPLYPALVEALGGAAGG